MSVSSAHLRDALSRGPGIPVNRKSAYPYREPPPLSWFIRTDPITKLAICFAGVASVFCVGAAVVMAIARATL